MRNSISPLAANSHESNKALGAKLSGLFPRYQQRQIRMVGVDQSQRVREPELSWWIRNKCLNVSKINTFQRSVRLFICLPLRLNDCPTGLTDNGAERSAVGLSTDKRWRDQLLMQPTRPLKGSSRGGRE